MTVRIELAELHRLIGEQAQLVEVLPPAEYAEAHLPGAINLPLKQLDRASAAALDRSRPVIVYCYDYLSDLSPRAACRLETLGFEQVYDYVPGKVDWLARNLPVQRDTGDVLTAGQLVRTDVVTCGLGDRVSDVAPRIAASPYGFALVLSTTGILLGRLRASALEAQAEATAEDLMESGPSTVRPDTAADELAQRLRKRDLKTAILTTPEGEPIGITLRADLEQRSVPPD
jgi:rhodanese-related sulfurtransferase